MYHQIPAELPLITTSSLLLLASLAQEPQWRSQVSPNIEWLIAWGAVRKPLCTAEFRRCDHALIALCAFFTIAPLLLPLPASRVGLSPQLGKRMSTRHRASPTARDLQRE